MTNDKLYLTAFGVGFIFGAAATPWVMLKLLEKTGF